MIALEPLGDRALLARFASENDAVLWVDAVRERSLAGILDVVLAYNSAAVHVDSEVTDFDRLEDCLRGITPKRQEQAPGKLIRLPVLYDGEDLADVADRLGIAESEVIALHCGRVYQVFAIGFQPGFPYAGYLPDILSGLSRREIPRVRVPAGSVAIAGRQTGIYPATSPGGWHLLGRTPLRIFDMEREYFPIRAGDRIQFVPIDRPEFAARKEQFL